MACWSNGLGEYGCSADCENCTRTLADPGFLTTTPSPHYSNSNTPTLHHPIALSLRFRRLQPLSVFSHHLHEPLCIERRPSVHIIVEIDKPP